MKNSEDLATAIVELRHEEAVAMVRGRVEGGEDSASILEECRAAMTTVGERFHAGEYFLAELMLSAEIFKRAVEILDPYLSAGRSAEPAGKIVLATMRGDIHDLGKNIFATLLRAQAFEVRDLGVNVEPAVLIEQVEDMQPDFVGLSALITTAFDAMKEAADLISSADAAERPKILIGGGVTTPGVKEYVGADYQTTDATAGVAYCIETVRGR